MRRIPVLLTILLSSVSLPLAAQEHHHELSADEVGSVHFLTSCAKTVELSFDRAVALLHSFQYEQAREAFGRMSRDQRLEKKEKLMLPFRQTVKCRKEDRNIMILLTLDDGGGMLAR